jgi:hypothetical protein
VHVGAIDVSFCDARREMIALVARGFGVSKRIDEVAATIPKSAQFSEGRVRFPSPPVKLEFAVF